MESSSYSFDQHPICPFYPVAGELQRQNKLSRRFTKNWVSNQLTSIDVDGRFDSGFGGEDSFGVGAIEFLENFDCTADGLW